MVRISKQAQKRQVCRKRPAAPTPKTGPKENNLPGGFKPHANAVGGTHAAAYFIPVQKTA